MEVVGAYIKRLHKSLQCVGFIAIVSTTFYSVLELILKIAKVRIKSLNKLFINFTSDIPFSKKKSIWEVHLGSWIASPRCGPAVRIHRIPLITVLLFWRKEARSPLDYSNLQKFKYLKNSENEN